MDFLTLHELSVQFDVPVRVLRYRLRKLLQADKLVDGEDYRRDDFVDETHFVWRINPASLVRTTGYQPVAKPATKTPPVVTQPGNEPQPIATSDPASGNQTLLNADTKPPGMEREMIDLLKGQVQVKDGQIADLTNQAKTLTALNEKLTGVVVHQSEEIRNLLRLTGGKTQLSELVTKPTSESAIVDSKMGNHGEPPADILDTSGARKAA